MKAPFEGGTGSVAEVTALAAAMQSAELCRLGYHAWTPWLGLPKPDDPLRYVSLCGREGCEAMAQYDL